MIEKGATLKGCRVRGPAVIAAGARLENAYIGPYTAIGEDVVGQGLRDRALDRPLGVADRRPARPAGAEPAGQGRDPDPQRRHAEDDAVPGRRQRGDLDPVKRSRDRCRRDARAATSRAAARNQGHEVVPLTRDDLDVTDPKRVDRAFGRHRPAAVDQLRGLDRRRRRRDQRARGRAVNGEGAARSWRARAANVGAKVALRLHRLRLRRQQATAPYTENDDPAPINAYGRTKLAGERATALATRRSFIVRTSWLFGPQGGNFVETMLRLGEGGAPVVVVHDQVGCPTYTEPPGRRPRPPRWTPTPSASTTWPAAEAARGTSSRWRSSASPRW